MENIFDFFLNLLFPPKCAFCRELCGSTFVCHNCASKMPPATCPYCGQGYGFCSCGFQFDLLLSPFPYKNGYRLGVLRLKNQADSKIIKAFSREMYGLINSTPFDYIVPVPANREKLKERGYNQAELLANEIGKLLSIQVRTDLLLRSQLSSVQHSLSSAQRKSNANSSYFPVKGKSLPANPHILLVDDVCTTGSTLNACTVALKHLGAETVTALCATYNQLRK